MKDSKIIFEINKQLEKSYNIKTNKIEKNEESTDGNVYMVYTAENKYVVKLYKDLKHVISMVKLHEYLFLHGMLVPQVIRTAESDLYLKIFEDKYIVVYSFVEGNHLKLSDGNGRLDYDIIKQVAKTLRKLHSITEGNNQFGLVKLPFVESIERQSVLHFDLTKNNIFIGNKLNNKVGLIDFDDAKYGASVCDLSIAIAILFFTKSYGANIEQAYQFIDEYYGEDNDLKEKEKYLIKDFAIKWIEYILNGNEFDTSTKESFEIRKVLIEKCQCGRRVLTNLNKL